jgi:hypothetical protein
MNHRLFHFGLGSFVGLTVLVLFAAYLVACGLTALATEVQLAREAARRTQCNNNLTPTAGASQPVVPDWLEQNR